MIPNLRKPPRSDDSPKFGSRRREQAQGQQPINSPSRHETPPSTNAPAHAQSRLSVIPAPQRRPAFARTETPKRSRAETTIGARTHRSGSQARSEKPAELRDIREETSPSGSPTRREIPTDAELYDLNEYSIVEVKTETAVVVEQPADTSRESSPSPPSLKEESQYTSSSEQDNSFVVTMDLTHGAESSRSVSEEESSSSHDAELSLASLKDKSHETGSSRWTIKPKRSPLDQLIPREGKVRFSTRNRIMKIAKPVKQGTVAKREKLKRQGTGLPSTQSHRGSAPSARHPIGRVQSLPQPKPPGKKDSSTTVVQDSLRKDSVQEALDDFTAFVEELDRVQETNEYKRTMSGLLDELESMGAEPEKEEKKV